MRELGRIRILTEAIQAHRDGTSDVDPDDIDEGDQAPRLILVEQTQPIAAVERWRASAEIHANPELAKVLSVPRSGPAVKVKRPESS